jgi:hypothetical protein
MAGKNIKASDGKMREIVFRETVILPAISTTTPERDYSFGAFLNEFVLQAAGMRSKENMADCASPPIFEWEEAIEEFYARTKAQLAEDPDAPREPSVPETPKFLESPTPAATAKNQELMDAFRVVVDAYKEARVPYDKALDASRVGGILYVSDAAFQAAKAAAEEAINARITPIGPAQTALDPAWARRVLRHFHAFAQSRAVTEVDIPVPAKPRPSLVAAE